MNMEKEPDTIVNENELRIIGMSRSGNHAIINWLIAQTTGRTCFLNCTEGKSNPFETARPMACGRCYAAKWPGFDLQAERAGRFAHKHWLIFSHEDTFLANACSDIFEHHHDQWVGPSRRRFDVLVLRDPFNLFASRLRANEGEVPAHIAVRIWKQHAKAMLGRVRRFNHAPVFITYNRWFADRDYRRRIARTLGLSFTDAGLQSVANVNGGSSFDGLSYDGRAQQMKVLERWKAYADHPPFREIFDHEMFQLSEQIFGPIPGTRRALAPEHSFVTTNA